MIASSRDYDLIFCLFLLRYLTCIIWPFCKAAKWDNPRGACVQVYYFHAWFSLELGFIWKDLKPINRKSKFKTKSSMKIIHLHTNTSKVIPLGCLIQNGHITHVRYLSKSKQTQDQSPSMTLSKLPYVTPLLKYPE